MPTTSPIRFRSVVRDDAQRDPYGAVWRLGDYGGRHYVIAPAALVTATDHVLRQLVIDLDARFKWSLAEASKGLISHAPNDSGRSSKGLRLPTGLTACIFTERARLGFAGSNSRAAASMRSGCQTPRLRAAAADGSGCRRCTTARS